MLSLIIDLLTFLATAIFALLCTHYTLKYKNVVSKETIYYVYFLTSILIVPFAISAGFSVFAMVFTNLMIFFFIVTIPDCPDEFFKEAVKSNLAVSLLLLSPIIILKSHFFTITIVQIFICTLTINMISFLFFHKSVTFYEDRCIDCEGKYHKYVKY